MATYTIYCILISVIIEMFYFDTDTKPPEIYFGL